MKAVYFQEHGDLEVLKYGDVPDPVAGAGEVVLQIKAAACNFNDIWARKGLPEVDLPLPHVSGTDAAGVVVDVGPGVDQLRVGDEVVTYPNNTCRVCAACLSGQEVFCKKFKIWGFQTGPYDGAFAQYAKVQAAQCLPKPGHLSWEDAAATSTSLLSVYRMLVTRAQTRPGDIVLIWGASGGTGHMAIKLTRLLGAVPVAVTSTDAKAVFCREMGAEHVIIHPREDVLERVRMITDGRGVDLVFDHVGETVWPISVLCLRWGGKIVICGATEGFQPTIDLRYLWNKQLTYLGSHIGTHPEWVECLRLVSQNKIAPTVTEVFALSDLAAAQRRMETRSLMGKIAIRVDT